MTVRKWNQRVSSRKADQMIPRLNYQAQNPPSLTIRPSWDWFCPVLIRLIMVVLDSAQYLGGESTFGVFSSRIPDMTCLASARGPQPRGPRKWGGKRVRLAGCPCGPWTAWYAYLISNSGNTGTTSKWVMSGHEEDQVSIVGGAIREASGIASKVEEILVGLRVSPIAKLRERRSSRGGPSGFSDFVCNWQTR